MNEEDRDIIFKMIENEDFWIGFFNGCYANVDSLQAGEITGKFMFLINNINKKNLEELEITIEEIKQENKKHESANTKAN